jgi:hypothetical protein
VAGDFVSVGVLSSAVTNCCVGASISNGEGEVK